MATVGFTDKVEIAPDKPVLEGMGESVVVEVFNPLTDNFRAKFSRSLPQAPNLSEQDRRVAEIGGIDVRKQGGVLGHTSAQYIEIPAGKTLKLPGDIAQVVVRQMTTYIIQQRGKKGQVSDPTLRREVEEEIVVNYKTMLQNQTLQPEEQFQKQIDELNNPDSEENIKQLVEEPSFPTEADNGSTPEVPEKVPSEDSSERPDNSWPEVGDRTAKKSVGRPKKKA